MDHEAHCRLRKVSNYDVYVTKLILNAWNLNLLRLRFNLFGAWHVCACCFLAVTVMTNESNLILPKYVTGKNLFIGQMCHLKRGEKYSLCAIHYSSLSCCCSVLH